MKTPNSATIDMLRPGSEYPDGNINARLTYTDAEISELAASLSGPDGQIRPFLVATHPKKPTVFFVFGGGRRRIAYEQLIKDGKLPKDHPIEIKDHGHISVADALSKSLADNQAVPMHPADQAQTFAKLAADRSPEDIARERGMTVRAVQQSIALGTALAPEIIAAWREGKLSREEVQVFTLASDFDAQTLALRDSWQFKNGKGIDIRDVRRKLTRNKEPEMKRYLGFVGIENARANGVEITEDFFGTGGVVKDMKPLKKLANLKMDEIKEKLRADGWLWIEVSMAENFMHHGYGELKAKPDYTVAEKKRLSEIIAALKADEDGDMDYELSNSLESEKAEIEETAQFRAFTEQQKAKSGVLVTLCKDGTVSYQGGLTRKEEKAKPSSAKPGSAVASNREPAPAKIPDINDKAEEHIQDVQDEALAELIAKDSKGAFALFLTAIVYCGWNDPVEWSNLDDVADGAAVIPGGNFTTCFAALRKLPIDKLAAKLAALVSRVSNVSGYQSGNKAALAIVEMVGEKNLQAGLAKRFDAKEYVAGATKPHMLAILAETAGAEVRDAHESDNEANLRLPVIEQIKSTGWLPPQLRTRVYAGPSAKKRGNVTKLKAKAKKPAKSAAPKKKAA